MQFDWSAIWPAIPLLIEGAKMTLWISVLGLAGGLVIGLLAGFARTFGGWIANHVALVFIEVIRGTPIVVQVMFIYFALPMAFNDLRIDPFTAAVVTIMINSGAYIAEITRGAVLSIHKGFREAGLALGLSRWETIRYVILPLALRRMLPPLGNQWIISIKDTSLFIVIGVAELTRQGQEIIAGNFRALEIWSAVAVFYLIITLVLHNIDLNIAQGEVVVIIGPSGSGKSTLLRCINKLEEITSGDLIVDGLKVNDPKVDERLIRQEAGMVFQQFYLFPHLTALENVMFGPLRVRGANKEEAEKLARELLAKVGLAERAHHYPSELSGGQQQRVAIARALAVKPKMMLFDEPTSALDPELRHEVLKVMQDLAEEGMTMVIVTHEIGFAEKVASRLIFIDKGRIAEDGDPQVLIKNPPSQRLQEFLQHVS
ncbi:TPA: glutamine ABC transporter ATP-binding protein GlnQ [Escherichia coli]|nr:glutamine ABC transporter ATP-binding protein GlnQ [Escherichia coli]